MKVNFGTETLSTAGVAVVPIFSSIELKC